MPDTAAQPAYPSKTQPTPVFERRHDVDWLRTIALVLLIIYHCVISFQPWGGAIHFPQSDETIGWIWIPMAMLNVWRLPLLFLVSGMGLCFALQRRTWGQLLGDRALRIVVPLVFGFFAICPVSVYFRQLFYGQDIVYVPNVGHLWFLLNITLYIIYIIGLILYFKATPDNPVVRFNTWLLKLPGGIYLFAIPVIAEAWITNPEYFTTYPSTLHGFFYGFICFIYGFIFISVKDVFWPVVAGLRWANLAVAAVLYLVRLFAFELEGMPNPLIALESFCWLLAVLGFGAVYLNKPSRLLTYCSQAVYPVYIVHLPVQFAMCYLIIPTAIPVFLKLVLVTAGTFAISWVLFELVIKRIKLIRPLFGMKWNLA